VPAAVVVIMVEKEEEGEQAWKGRERETRI
jgi:hypothetical protein